VADLHYPHYENVTGPSDETAGKREEFITPNNKGGGDQGHAQSEEKKKKIVPSKDET